VLDEDFFELVNDHPDAKKVIVVRAVTNNNGFDLINCFLPILGGIIQSP